MVWHFVKSFPNKEYTKIFTRQFLIIHNGYKKVNVSPEEGFRRTKQMLSCKFNGLVENINIGIYFSIVISQKIST